MSTLDGPRKLVKATYAHKRNRTSKNQAQMNPLSSPLEILGDQEEVNLTRTEMMRRMLKRSRHAGQSTTYDEDQDSNQTQVLERRIKRTKRSTRPNAATQNEFSMSLNDIDSTEDSLFQTPYEEGYVYPSLILKPLVPEQMSPVPIANRILSRTTSRRLKENSATSRTTSSRGGLASPFASRHNSANSSPGSKSRPKSNLRANRHSKSRTTRPALSTKSRSIASSLNDNNSAFGANSQVLQHESVFTMNHSSHPSPLRPGQNPNPITRNRYPSSHTLTQIPQQDWLVPAKALTRTRTPDDLDMHTPPDFGIIIEKSEVGDSSFLADLPMAFSTPLPTRSSHLTSDIRVYAPGSGLYASSRSGSSTNAIIDELQPYYGSGGFDPAGNERDIYDVAMNDVLSSSRPRKPLHISGNSIISSSGDFTLGPSDYSSPSCAAAGSAIVHDDEDNRNEDTDETDSLFPTHDDAMQKERSPTTHLSILQPKQSLLAHEIAMYPTTSSPALNLAVPRSRSVPFIDELMASEVPAHTSTSFPEPLSMAEMDVEIESAESALRAMFDDMGLANEADQTRPSKSAAALTSRTRSLDSPASIQLDFTTTDNSKQKAGSARNRASTIRASDFRQSTASPVVTGVSCTSHTRRTRSGTVVGRPGSGVVIASVLSQRSIDSSSQCQSQVCTTVQSEVADIESDDELLLKAPGWLDEDLEYLGLPMHKFHSRALGPQPGEESDDELLLTGKRRYV